MYYLLVTFYVVACFVLMIVILLQQGKGGDIANAFGGGSSQAVFGARAGATVLTKITAGLTVAFMTLALVLSIWGSRGTTSVVGGVEPPAPAPAATTPITPAPAATTPDATPPPAATEPPPPAKKQ